MTPFLEMDSQPLPWAPPHLTVRGTYMQDPSTSTWRVNIAGTSHLPSPAHPRGHRKSAASPWPDHNPWLFTDSERKSRVASDVRMHEMWAEYRPLTPEPGEETRQERRMRLLRSESEVEAMQAKERILDASYGMVPKKREECVEKESGESERKDSTQGVKAAAVALAGVELAGAAALEVRPTASGGWAGVEAVKPSVEPATLAESAEEASVAGEWAGVDGEKATVSLAEVEEDANGLREPAKIDGAIATATTTMDGHTTTGPAGTKFDVTENSHYTEAVITEHERVNDDSSKDRSDALQFWLDYVATTLMLLGLLGLYVVVAG